MIPNYLWGSERQVPETDEDGWGGEGTGIVFDLIEGVDTLSARSPAGVISPRLNHGSSPTSLAGGGTLTKTAALHEVQGTGGPVTLSAVTAIADGTVDGEELVLAGLSDVNTVTILDGANVLIWGTLTLGAGHHIRLRWDTTLGVWVEEFRSAGHQLRDQGALELYEDIANGTDKVSIRAPVGLAASYTLTLPTALDAGGYLQVGADGTVIVTAGSASLDTAYDAGRTITVDAGPVEMEAPAGSVGYVLEILQEAAAQPGLLLRKTGVGAGALLDLDNAGTGPDILGNAWEMSAGGVLAAARVDLTDNSANPVLDLTQAGAGLDVRGTGTSWQVTKAGSAKFLDVVAGGHEIDARYYGAIGSGAVDDTAAIQAAIDAAEAGAWKVVKLPPGTYNVSTLTQKTGVTLRGSGYTTILSAVGTTPGHAVIEVNNKQNWGLERLKIDGNSAGSTLLPDTLGIMVTGTGGDCANFIIDDVWLWDCHYRGLNVRSAVNSRIRNIFIEEGCDEIGFLVGTNTAETFTVQNLQIENVVIRNVLTDGGGIWRQTGTGTVKDIQISNLIVHRPGLANTGHGWFSHNVQDLTVSNFAITDGQNVNGNGLHIESGSRHRYTNGIIRDMQLYGLTLAGTYPTDMSFVNVAINSCQRGVVIEGNTNTPAQRIHFTDVDVSECEYDGWFLAGWYVFLTGCTAADNGQNGAPDYAGFFLQSALVNGKPLHIHFTACHAYDSGVNKQAYGISFGDNCDRIHFDSTSTFQGTVEGVHFANGNIADDVYFSLGRGPIGKSRFTNGTAAPGALTWAVGDIVWNTTPSAGGVLCWVCVTAGTPGTWKAIAVAA